MEEVAKCEICGKIEICNVYVRLWKKSQKYMDYDIPVKFYFCKECDV